MVVLVVERVPGSSVGVTEVKAFEARNNFDVVTGVVVEVIVVFGSKEPFTLGCEFGSLELVIFVVIETVPRCSVGVMDVKAYEDRNDFDVVVEVVVVFGFID